MTTDAGDSLALLVRRSHAGDAGALGELKENLPALIRLGDLLELEREAQERWAACATGGPERRAARLRRLEKAAARLVRPGAGPLEELLASRAALAAARLADLRRLAGRVEGEATTVALDVARRVKRADREVAAADRTLRVFQERVPPGP
jgi:hypothetical protein